MHYYDSMAAYVSGRSRKLIGHLLHWLSDETAARGGEEARLDTRQWSVIMHPAGPVPQQLNGIDCGEGWGWGGSRAQLALHSRFPSGSTGVFMLSFALAIARGEPFRFSQADIPRIRRIFAAALATCNSRVAAGTL